MRREDDPMSKGEGWSRRFDEPIDANGFTITSLRDAGNYILTLTPDEASTDHWQLAMKCLIDASERGGILMLAQIAVKQALHHGEPDAPPKQRSKAVKKFRVIR
jgi:hypothetical protein